MKAESGSSGADRGRFLISDMIFKGVGHGQRGKDSVWWEEHPQDTVIGGRQASCGISRYVKWFRLGALEEVLSSWLWVINRSLRPSVLFWKALESFTGQIFMEHPVCCGLGHSTVSPGETLSPMLDPWKCLLTPKLFESAVGEKPSM